MHETLDVITFCFIDSVLISRAQLQCAAVDVRERNKEKRKRGREREAEGNSPAVKDALSN